MDQNEHAIKRFLEFWRSEISSIPIKIDQIGIKIDHDQDESPEDQKSTKKIYVGIIQPTPLSTPLERTELTQQEVNKLVRFFE